MNTHERIGTNRPHIGDTVLVIDGEHEGQRGNVRVLASGGPDGRTIAVRLATQTDLVRVSPDEITVVSTEEIDRARRVLEQAGWTLTPPEGART